MGRKLPFTSLLFSTFSKDPEPFPTSSPSPGPWPSCRRQPKTHSFSANSSMDPCFSTSLEVEEEEEAVMRGLRSNRLFFDPDAGGGSSTLVEARCGSSAAGRRGRAAAFEGGVAVAMESTDPLRDFRVSMEEMLEARGVRDWVWLHEMLGWFLMANDKGTHGFIFGAFLDLFMGSFMASSSSFSSGSRDCSSSSCSLSSSCSCGTHEEMDYGRRRE